jgi:hypothetical protein
VVNEKARFEASYVVDLQTGCWLWARSVDSGGAGRMRFQGRLRQAHQVALLLAGVEVDPRREITASCGRRECVNPEHLHQVARVNNPSRSLRYLGATRRVRRTQDG